MSGLNTQANDDDDDSLEAPKVKLITEGILIDFLGGLVPGMLFIFTVFVALAVPIQSCLSSLSNEPHKSLGEIIYEYSNNIKDTPSAFWISLFLIVALISFIVGQLFYRSDPRKPDRVSFLKLSKSKGYTSEECKREFGAANDEDCKFPYPEYDEYLKARGLNHLLPLVVWDDDSSEHAKNKQHEKRSKQYINIFKIRLRYYFPEKCGIIIWNEAHIRLAASGWYVARILLVASVIGLIISTCSFIVGLKPLLDAKGSYWDIGHLIGTDAPSFLAPGAILAFALLLKSQIERFLHYQRLREVFFVLETAYTAFRDKYELLSPPLDKKDVEELRAMTLRPPTESP